MVHSRVWTGLDPETNTKALLARSFPSLVLFTLYALSLGVKKGVTKRRKVKLAQRSLSPPLPASFHSVSVSQLLPPFFSREHEWTDECA